jgi:hypothetical protein
VEEEGGREGMHHPLPLPSPLEIRGTILDPQIGFNVTEENLSV